ncbi:DivIVA domain-containing protein [Actinopolymorpha cephalotaxi]|uniref:Cell wall synthesis protein Wag31 n=1 Tax=Actinopolymorpha cephalotaxi TaxID=504797 RepID=A0A1I2WAW2_9ACTN|nr:DivIVA domain-containing protein [Actinopolymorpha cephalotaxi]NYH82693.1 DivIVA domain-containing protein [Actinopolymorpha cephalotaxi]SFG97767.1 DivIVA domain-containing protein [Actinopolymorpha cephalotaxi]
MPLTPEDVRNKRFTPVRLREGYDMGEVDQFLDEVESELERLNHENEDLRQKLASAQRGDGDRDRGRDSGRDTGRDSGYGKPEQPEPQQPQVRQTTPQPGPSSIAEASSAAARLLEIATQNADQLVSESKEQGNRILSDARARAERLENEARGLASRLESEARSKSEQLDRDTAERRTQLFGQLEKEKTRLQREVDELRTYERQYRSRLKAYFESQLRVLAGQGNLENGLESGNGPRSGNSHKPALATGGDREERGERERERGGRGDRMNSGGTPRLNALLEDDDDSSL